MRKLTRKINFSQLVVGPLISRGWGKTSERLLDAARCTTCVDFNHQQAARRKVFLMTRRMRKNRYKILFLLLFPIRQIDFRNKDLQLARSFVRALTQTIAISRCVNFSMKSSIKLPRSATKIENTKLENFLLQSPTHIRKNSDVSGQNHNFNEIFHIINVR